VSVRDLSNSEAGGRVGLGHAEIIAEQISAYAARQGWSAQGWGKPSPYILPTNELWGIIMLVVNGGSAFCR